MTGYQEILTDPSYCRQIVTLTYPHVGNTGTTPEDLESGAVYAAGLVIRDLPLLHSSWRATESLTQFLFQQFLEFVGGKVGCELCVFLVPYRVELLRP